VFEFLSNGSSVKSLHPGWAAHAGITAAQLARHGMTGPQTSLEGRYGLFASFARDTGAAERFRGSLDGIGREWKIASAAFKFYPCCHYIHPFIEAARRLMQQQVSPDAISEIVCRVPRGAAPVICEPWPAKQRPASSHAARWSLPVAVAAQVVEGRVDLDTFSRPIAAEVLRLASRITWQPLEPDNFPKAFEAEVTFVLSDGTSHHARIDDVFGNVGRPATEEDVRIKFRANALRKLPESQVQALEASIDRLATSPGLARFTAACRGKAAP
jgi:2-methylcitrate dehydratase PrpD